MELSALLERKRDTIVEKWIDSVIKTYPQGSSEFLGKQKDRFQNPVGHTISQSVGSVYDQIISTMDTGDLRQALDGIIRIRSVQDFTASEAVGFVFELKSVMRDILGDRMLEREQSKELADLESRIDQVALLAFDKYMECRDKLHEVRTNEIRNRSERLLGRVSAESGLLENRPEPIDDDR